jgi:monofunctional biosynthetic peptidoglycan transglycosylase
MAKPRAKRRTAKKRPRRFRRFVLIALAGLMAICLVTTAIPITALRWMPPLTSAFMLRSRLADPATGRPCTRIDYRWVPWERISPYIPLAVLVAEDQRFLMHSGFDLDSIADAVGEGLQGGRMRGASTVTQQVAKNLLLWPGRSLIRKGLEAWLTVWIELLWPKRRIVEVHVNIAQFGPCLFGAEAASQRFFARPAAEIAPGQAALLAAALPDPAHIRPDDPGPYAIERAAEILRDMKLPEGPFFLRGL